ncbi:AsmA family protein [Vibrio ziniensis]|uniref:AsmA family protein n=1 Tax=Vibrio ziniensis TaxID=2711221 RepID=A0A6G7CEP7_9VIBR|nr:AsmA family protein [Vibrio ziniensis]QIH40574.1 AsmA family protein [Vibrio ziniensis]
MKKLLALGIGVIAILLTLTLVVFGVMHTRYFTPSAQWLTQQLWPQKLSFSKLEYEYPTHFTLHNVSIETDEQPISFSKVDIWLNEKLIKQDKLVIDSLLLDGANFSQGLPASNFLHYLQLNQLALHNVDFSQQGLIARGVNLQVKHPQWKDTEQLLPYGELQLSADQFYWNGEAFDKILIDADYKPSDSTVYGASFKWQGGDFSGQAEQLASGWSLINTTINHLDLPESLSSTTDELQQQALKYITHINSLDILNSQLTIAGLRLENFAASLENLSLTHSIWQQDQGYLSLNADTILWKNTQWIEPSIKLDFSDQTIAISDFSTEVLQGSVQLSGTVTPSSLHLKELNVHGIKWFGESQQDLAWLDEKWPQFDELVIEQLNINNLQLIQLYNKPFWQLSGLTIEGSNTQLIKDNRLGLWNGDVVINANSASIGNIVSSQGLIDMRSEQGVWQLNKAFIPLEQGYLEANASWDFTKASSPWSLTAHADGLPFSVMNYFVQLPVKIDATTEFDVNAEGLAGDYSMLAHSISGELNGSMREGIMMIESPESLVVQPFEIENFNLIADRGRIHLAKTALKGSGLEADITAQLDLVSPQEGQFKLNVAQGCENVSYDLQNNKQEFQPCPK